MHKRVSSITNKLTGGSKSPLTSPCSKPSSPPSPPLSDPSRSKSLSMHDLKRYSDYSSSTMRTSNIKLKVGITTQELDSIYNHAGRILLFLLKDKADDKLYEILSKLQPIHAKSQLQLAPTQEQKSNGTTSSHTVYNINNYMRQFNYDSECALKCNAEMACLMRLWMAGAVQSNKKAAQLMTSIERTENTVKLLEIQDLHWKTINEMKVKKKTDNELPIWLVTPSVTVSSEESTGSAKSGKSEGNKEKLGKKSSNELNIQTTANPNVNNSSPKRLSDPVNVELKASSGQSNGERTPKLPVKIKLRICLSRDKNNECEEHICSIDSALKLIHSVKGKFHKHLQATEWYMKSIEGLMSINENNRKLISNWKFTDEVKFEINNLAAFSNIEKEIP